uniref:Uncharacterized protein n=1 Tax=Arundo donax TaxID=35708 RepID=A0A0A9D9Q8_ARUDO
MESRAEKAPRSGGRRPASAAAGRWMEARRRTGSEARERLLRAAAESQWSGRPSGVDQRRPRQRQSGVEAFQVASWALGAACPCSAGFTLVRTSAMSEDAEAKGRRRRRKRRGAQGCIESNRRAAGKGKLAS